jgi:hypothetical protein
MDVPLKTISAKTTGSKVCASVTFPFTTVCPARNI